MKRIPDAGVDSDADRPRKVERTSDLENKVVILTRERDALALKNRIMRQILDFRNATVARETQVTSYLRHVGVPTMPSEPYFRLKNAELLAACEEVDTMKEATLSETDACVRARSSNNAGHNRYLRSPAIHHAISLLGPEFNFVDYLDGENAFVRRDVFTCLSLIDVGRRLFQDIAAKFSEDVQEEEGTDEDEEGDTEEEGESEEEEEEAETEEDEQ